MNPFFALILGLTIAGEAMACSCIPMTRDQIIAQSALVVRGTVIRAGADKVADPNYMTIVSFKIAERIKGEAPDIITVATANNSAACGINLPEDTVMELALHEGEDGIYRASLCNQLGLGQKP